MEKSYFRFFYVTIEFVAPSRRQRCRATHMKRGKTLPLPLHSHPITRRETAILKLLPLLLLSTILSRMRHTVVITGVVLPRNLSVAVIKSLSGKISHEDSK